MIFYTTCCNELFIGKRNAPESCGWCTVCNKQWRGYYAGEDRLKLTIVSVKVDKKGGE